MKHSMIPMIVLAALVVAAVSFAWQGVAMHTRVGPEEATFHQLQQAYFTVAKTERDTAPAGSELNQQLVEIQNYPSELLRLKLVGIGKILTGIFLLLAAIAFLLFMMPFRLAVMMRERA